MKDFLDLSRVRRSNIANVSPVQYVLLNGSVVIWLIPFFLVFSKLKIDLGYTDIGENFLLELLSSFHRTISLGILDF